MMTEIEKFNNGEVPHLAGCPFCPPDLSSPAFVPVTDGADVYGEEVLWKARCLGCGCSCGAPEVTLDAAAEVWNTRTERTCHMNRIHEEPDACGYVTHECSECGLEVDFPYDCPPTGWCAGCGARVVEP